MQFPLTQSGVHRIDSIVSNIICPHFGVDVYPSNEQKAVAYLYFLIKDHPFTDGNKRTATLAFSTVCLLNDLPENKDFPLDSLAVFIEKTRDADHQTVIEVIAEQYFK